MVSGEWHLRLRRRPPLTTHHFPTSPEKCLTIRNRDWYRRGEKRAAFSSNDCVRRRWRIDRASRGDETHSKFPAFCVRDPHSTHLLECVAGLLRSAHRRATPSFGPNGSFPRFPTFRSSQSVGDSSRRTEILAVEEWRQVVFESTLIGGDFARSHRPGKRSHSDSHPGVCSSA